MPDLIRVETVHNIVSERVCPDICQHAVCRELIHLNREVSRKAKKFAVQVVTNGLIEEHQRNATFVERERIIKLIEYIFEFRNIAIPEDLFDHIRNPHEQA
jgi:hypothetical protein